VHARPRSILDFGFWILHSRTATLPGVVLSVVFLAGCQAPHAATPPVLPDRGNAELILAISNQPFVTAEAAYRATYILAHDQPYAGDFEALAQTLETEKLISGLWKYAPERYVTRADVGYLVCRACKIRTGVNWNLTGLGRYAWRELMYHNIAEGGDENNLISGGEFVGVLLRAEEYLTRTGKSQPVELGPRPR
jgi:hypothetical protein